MRIAVVTPVYRTPMDWLERCLSSVARQTTPCTHLVVSDGDDTAFDNTRLPPIELLRLPRPHQDLGNAARAIGSVSAIANDFDAIAYLDSDNWFEPDHLQQLVELQVRSRAAVCTCARNLVDLSGELLGRCPEVDGKTFVDTSCLFLTRAAFGVVSTWYSMSRRCAAAGDRLVWRAIKEQKLQCAHSPRPTVNYRTNYGAHYEAFGRTPPQGAKRLYIDVSRDGRMLSAKVDDVQDSPPINGDAAKIGHVAPTPPVPAIEPDHVNHTALSAAERLAPLLTGGPDPGKLDDAVRLIRERWPEVVSEAQDDPVFILGAGWRCGSTLLQRMLFSHCFMWGEPFGSSGLIERLSQPLLRFSHEWPPDIWFANSPNWDGKLSEKWVANMYPPLRDFLAAYVQFFRTLLAEPSRQRGYARWGMKEVRYGIEHALFLHWLFPRARFLFLVRNPYECWGSFRRIKARTIRYWPEKLITTPEQLGGHWLNLAEKFCLRHQEVDGLLVRYEQLTDPSFDLQDLEDYLGFGLERSAREKRVGASPEGVVPAEEMARLRTMVEPLASELGYEPVAVGAI